MNHAIYGLRSWLLQRLTAVYLFIYILYFLVNLLFDPWWDYQQWRGWLAHPAVNIATLLFFAALLLHAWVGLRDIVIDYIQPLAVRFVALVLIGTALLAMGGWAFLTLMAVLA